MNSVEDLTVALVQSGSIWEEREANFYHYESLLEQIQGEADIVLLPEMFATGFVPSHGKISEQEGEIVQAWMQEQATRFRCALCGTAMIPDGERYYNRFYFVRPDGIVHVYDKRHLFALGGEKQAFSAGTERVLISYLGWKLFPQICYDLRFPVWERNVWDERNGYEYDVMLLLANWPASRINMMDRLLCARAIENQCYVACVNRIGQDGRQTEYNGHSAGIDFKGDILAQAMENREEIVIITCSRTELLKFRHDFPAGQDQDRFTIGS